MKNKNMNQLKKKKKNFHVAPDVRAALRLSIESEHDISSSNSDRVCFVYFVQVFHGKGPNPSPSSYALNRRVD